MNLQNIVHWFRACAFCGYSLGSVEWLCLRCEAEFLKRMSLKTRWMGGDIRHQYLFYWDKEDQFLGQLVKSLKGKGLEKSYERLSIIFSSFPQVIPPDHIYFPTKGSEDHAYQWAFYFSLIHQCPMEPLFLRDQGKQSLLSKSQRQQRSFLPLKAKGKAPCFVDDVVTSGSTAQAAYKALGQPKNFTVWSLFYRSPL